MDHVISGLDTSALGVNRAIGSGADYSLEALRRVLGGLGEESVMIVAHYGVIDLLCGAFAAQPTKASNSNGVIIECVRSKDTGRLNVVRWLSAPGKDQ